MFVFSVYVSECVSQWGYCQGSPPHSGIVIEMKHNVNLCPEAHLLYSRLGIWPCETQQLFYFPLSLFISLSLQHKMSWHYSLLERREL